MKQLLLSISILCLSGNLFAQDSLTIGQNAPEISLSDIDGTAFTLTSLKGKVVLIDFWASWCAPCMKEQPELKNLYEKFIDSVKADKFEIVGVSLDKDRENWKKGVKRFKTEWVHVSDLLFWKSPIAKDYKLEGLPYNVLIDENGVIIAINLHGNELENAIQNHFNKKEE
ncbi:MAG: thioredoxin [Candidatus Fluviicola riflensis]|nr:MAG: thioredoxin [Candidatus Fluviicola riflensis]OGS78543.1 MAG: thioredoxin [Candidatus Fluviicola riflensis]OGS85598.1 MAG: thioredoxin [Fluviicola sp. RIFCSPHIGHO2_01_FULL_43_53]OGS89521.1 MAG: thioredoxin [Fluviicola sp. RIFCSPHIGHO2_12_FULL_43_24]